MLDQEAAGLAHRPPSASLARPLLLLAGLLPQKVLRNGTAASCLAARQAFEDLPSVVQQLANLSGMRRPWHNVSQFAGRPLDSPTFRASQRLRRRRRRAQSGTTTGVASEEALETLAPLTVGSGLGAASPFRWGAGGSVIVDLLSASSFVVRQIFQGIFKQINKSIAEDTTLSVIAVAGAVGAAGMVGSLPNEVARLLSGSASMGNLGLQASLVAGAAAGDLLGGPLTTRNRAYSEAEHSQAPVLRAWSRRRLVSAGVCCALLAGLLFAGLRHYSMLPHQSALKGNAAPFPLCANR